MPMESEHRGDLLIVDDDPAVRDGLALLFEGAGFRVGLFGDGTALLTALAHRSADAVLLDVRLPDLDGVEVLRQLVLRKFAGPVLIMSGYADIPMAVEAIKAGAADVIEKPCEGARMVARVVDALAGHSRQRTARGDPVAALGPDGASLLTPRERDVLQELVRGASNKEAGRSLGISPRTIEVHRARIMEKLGARNAADLVRVIYDERRAELR